MSPFYPGDDVHTYSISTHGRFPFGPSTIISNIYVSIYIIMLGNTVSGSEILTNRWLTDRRNYSNPQCTLYVQRIILSWSISIPTDLNYSYVDRQMVFT